MIPAIRAVFLRRLALKPTLVELKEHINSTVLICFGPISDRIKQSVIFRCFVFVCGCQNSDSGCDSKTNIHIFLICLAWTVWHGNGG